MDNQEKIPAASIAEVERFWADGKDAIQSSTGEQPGTIRHSFPVETMCYRCGERGGNWHAGPVIQHGRELQLGRNQLAALGTDGNSFRIYTHCCVDFAANIDMPGVGVVPLEQASAGCSASSRVSAGDGVEVVRPPDPVASVEPVREITLRDRLVASMSQLDGDRLDIVITPRGVAMLEELAEPGRVLEFRASLRAEEKQEYTPDYRAIAKEMLTALYGMIGHFGMPIKSRELSDEVETALLHAEAAKVDEVLL